MIPSGGGNPEQNSSLAPRLRGGDDLSLPGQAPSAACGFHWPLRMRVMVMLEKTPF
jgi:hypothetical protein